MTIIQAIVLGLVQGITEFLPVSSSGHLVLFQKIFGVQEPTLSFDVVLHIGTLIPVFIIFNQQIISLIKKPFQKYSYLIIVATLPAVLVALLFNDVIESMFSGEFLPFAFALTGCILLFADKVSHGKKTDANIKYTDAVVIGLAQAVAILPGVSRSGSTISGSLARGLDRQTAAKFSFLLSIPAILGAAVLQLKDLATGGEHVAYTAMFFGFIAAMLSGYVAIKFMLKLINEGKLKFFAYYVFVLAVLVFIDQYFIKFFFV